MKDNCSRKFWCGRAAENIARGMLVAFAALAISGIASAQDKQDKKEEFNFDLSTAPVTPPAITPPVGNRLFLAGHAFGSQGYVCLPLGSGVSWTVNNARPEATLFANPSWRVPIRVARTLGRLAASYCKPSGRKTGRRAGES